MLQIEKMQEILEQSIPHKRYKHSIAVYETALKLAAAHKLNAAETADVAVASLLHDCGRVVGSKESVARAQEVGVSLTAIELAQPVLIHALLGVYYAKASYGVEDQQILDAIRYHTTGKDNMTQLAKIVYLADMIEPNRDFPGVEELRKLAKENLDTAMLKAYENTIGYLLDEKLLIHPDCIAGYNQLRLAANRK